MKCEQWCLTMFEKGLVSLDPRVAMLSRKPLLTQRGHIDE